MAVRQINGRWVVEFAQGGTRVFRRCPPGITKADAQQYEAAIRRDLFAARSLGVRPALSIAAALQNWLDGTLAHKRDQRMPKSNALTWAPFIEGRRVEDAPEVAAAAIAAWTADGLGPATINRRLAALKAALRYALKRGDTEANKSFSSW